MKTLLIDGDIFIYQTAAAVEEPIDWGDDIWTLHGDMTLARQTFDLEMSKLQEHLGVEKITIALSDSKNNWRKGVLDTYKNNRKGKRKPVVYVPLRDHAEEHYDSVCLPNLEADDVLGIMAKDDGSTVIVSDDKDLKTIPGVLYIPHESKTVEISLEEADRNHLIQTLTGDSADGYKGCPGVGPVKAARILEECTWDEVLGAYTKAGLNESVALTQARVARILRDGEYDFDTNVVNLWNPPIAV